MVNTQVQDLTANTDPQDTDVAYMVDDPAGVPASRKIALSVLKTYVSASPTLVTPALGTPSSGVLTSCTGLPLGGLVATTVSRALVSNASGVIVPATTTDTEIGYVNGVTSAIQTQMNLKAPLASPTFTGTVTLPAATVRTQFSSDINGAILGTVGTVTYLGLNGSTITSTFGNHETPMSVPGTLKNFRINVLANASTDAVACDILINSAGAVPSLSITALTTGQFASANSATAAAASKVVYRFGSATTGSVTASGVSVEYATP